MPGVTPVIIPDGSPCAQHSLLVDNAHALAAATFLRDDPDLRLDFCSNVTGVDWLDRVVKTRVKAKRLIEGAEKEVEEVLKKFGIGKDQLPKIRRTDPCVRAIEDATMKDIAEGSLIKIVRNSPVAGVVVSYRVVVKGEVK